MASSFDRFIVDFYCPTFRLVIELDGSVYNTPEAREYVLSKLELSIIRFSNDEVRYDVDCVLENSHDNLAWKSSAPVLGAGLG